MSEPKRRGRPRKETTLSVGERVRKHRARKDARVIQEIENNPEIVKGHLKAALDSANERIRALIATNATLNQRLAEANGEVRALLEEVARLESQIEFLSPTKLEP